MRESYGDTSSRMTIGSRGVGEASFIRGVLEKRGGESSDCRPTAVRRRQFVAAALAGAHCRSARIRSAGIDALLMLEYQISILEYQNNGSDQRDHHVAVPADGDAAVNTGVLSCVSSNGGQMSPARTRRAQVLPAAPQALGLDADITNRLSGKAGRCTVVAPDRLADPRLRVQSPRHNRQFAHWALLRPTIMERENELE
jgi:hypothetical protein